MNIFMPCALVRPIALRHPYSHTLSFTFWVVETISKKNARVNAMKPMMPTKILKSMTDDSIDVFANARSMRIVPSPLKYERIPLAMYSLLSPVIF